MQVTQKTLARLPCIESGMVGSRGFSDKWPLFWRAWAGYCQGPKANPERIATNDLTPSSHSVADPDFQVQYKNVGVPKISFVPPEVARILNSRLMFLKTRRQDIEKAATKLLYLKGLRRRTDCIGNHGFPFQI
jgi:hypothetical protein